jgi:metallophosphoesterase superfamily enzyme
MPDFLYATIVAHNNTASTQNTSLTGTCPFRIAMGVALLCTSALYAQQMPLKRLAVISDVHLMAPALLQKEGKAFDNYIANDRKLLVESPELLDSISKRLLAYHPQIVFITGDLTKDGERISHQLLVDNYLKPLKAQGIRVFVVPGNHDVNNPHAKVYNGENTQRTTTVSAKDLPQFGITECFIQYKCSVKTPPPHTIRSG